MIASGRGAIASLCGIIGVDFMQHTILRRLVSLPFILFIVSILIFSFVLFLSPSERVAVFVSSPDALQHISLDNLIQRYGLDDPFYVQYGRWIKGIFQGELGWSVSLRMPIQEALARRIPATIELLIFGQLLIVSGGVFLGTLAAKYHNRLPDHLIRFFTILGVSIPEFMSALFLLIIFYVNFGLLPPGRLSLNGMDVVYGENFVQLSGMNLLDALYNRRPDIFFDALSHLILPSAAYAFAGLAASVRLMRQSMLEQANKEYVNTAYMKGLSDGRVWKHHIRRNALVPFVTFTGMQIPSLLGGAVIVETIFNYPGMGTFIVTAAKGLDFPAIIASSLVISFIIILSNLLVDLLYGIISPQMRKG